MNHHPDDFLDRDFTCDPREALKNALLRRTTLIIRRRHHLRRAGIAGLAAACYLAGIATTWFVVPRAAVRDNTISPPVLVAENPPKPSPPPEQPPERPEVYELQALTAAPAERSMKFRKAGDLYLSQSSDYASALRCYTASFNAAGDDALEFSPDDNWLVMAIKNARYRERNDVK